MQKTDAAKLLKENLLERAIDKARGIKYGRYLQTLIADNGILSNRILKQHKKRLHELGFEIWDFTSLDNRRVENIFSQRVFGLVHKDYRFQADPFNWRYVHLVKDPAQESSQAERMLSFKIQTKSGKVTGFDVIQCAL